MGVPYREAARRGPDAVASGAEDGGLIDVAGAHQACRRQISNEDLEMVGNTEISRTSNQHRLRQVVLALTIQLLSKGGVLL